ncbi:hypothetical protein CYR52_05330 [Chimaeribacter arupi]|uniref:Uncharacterized protein n=1 Tax=Chimaeribacter arupi TaxID=2060066 RepID=A0A2N5ENK6_9GAMM|nr:hypothetical protein CYR34_10145 [Chimaeribacter arupi]PLR53610.1 hypothetical protein CYR52_05330 [Chimaeribacter arupi]
MFSLTQIAKALGASVAAEAMDAVQTIGADAVLGYKQPVPKTLDRQYARQPDSRGLRQAR